MRTLSAQILVSKYYSLIKESDLLEEIADSGTDGEKIQDEPGTSCGARKQRRTQSVRWLEQQNK